MNKILKMLNYKTKWQLMTLDTPQPTREPSTS